MSEMRHEENDSQPTPEVSRDVPVFAVVGKVNTGKSSVLAEIFPVLLFSRFQSFVYLLIYVDYTNKSG